jgi:hypothetical protein
MRIVDEATLTQARGRKIRVIAVEGETIAAITLARDGKTADQLIWTYLNDQPRSHVGTSMPLNLGVVDVKALHQRRG